MLLKDRSTIVEPQEFVFQESYVTLIGIRPVAGREQLIKHAVLEIDISRSQALNGLIFSLLISCLSHLWLNALFVERQCKGALYIPTTTMHERLFCLQQRVPLPTVSSRSLKTCLQTPGQRADPAFTIARRTDLQPRVMVRDTISFDNPSPLVVTKDNGDQYRAKITNFFIPELNNHDVQELRFQQDGATCHTARATIDLLKDTFGDRLISRFGPVNWPSRSCDLTPLDYFLWGCVKSLVYADKPQTLDHLEDNIRRVIADIRPQMLEKVIENWTSRLDYIRTSRGSPMTEIIFKM
ncbi:uncharacterized protein TNCV_4472321 [Trichonephila clavipes]|uniref:Transposase n=1 Tax=Trichonephila clavipes TaxID=2585209 RepID=A0A8X6SDL9_TRICX|nr:uncharacterized protein TNCV_4472321 [Trichonephila clavipes]